MKDFFLIVLIIAAAWGIYSIVQQAQKVKEATTEVKQIKKEIRELDRIAEEEAKAEKERLETVKAAMRQIIEDKGIPDFPEDKIEQAAKDFCNYMVFVANEQELALTKVAYKRYRPEHKGEWIFTTTEKEFCQYMDTVLLYYYGDFPGTIKELIEEDDDIEITYDQIDWDIAKPKLFKILKKITCPNSPDDMMISDDELKQAILSSIK